MTGPHPAVAAVRLAVRRALDGAQEVTAGDLVLVACSGGADSLALAAAAAFEAPKAGLRAGSVTVDHGLQDGSAARAEAAGVTARGLGLRPVEVVRAEVATEGGPEAAARRARYAALDGAADRHGASAVLLGHTLDDQAESVLLGLARGSGARSLAGMRTVSGRYVRPLLGVRRQVTSAACEALGLRTWDDPHNADPAYARARVRHETLPVLERTLGPGVAAALARTARLLADDADALDGWADSVESECAHPDGGLDAERLGTLPAAVRRRVLRAAALSAGSPAGSLSASHVAALDALVTEWHGQSRVDLPGGVSAVRRCGRLLLAVEYNDR
jgi:tRNA(Ile)-lysidine synthase